MPDQMTIPTSPPMAEPSPSNTQGFPSFADLPESPSGWTPRITFDEEPQQEAAPVDTAPEPSPSSPPAVESSPPPAASAPSGGAAQEMFAAMVAYDQHKKAEVEAAKAEKESREWQPPTLSEDEVEEVLGSAAKFREYERAKDKWHRDAAVAMVKPLAEKLQGAEQVLQTVLQRDHVRAWDEVRDAAQEKGIDADKFYGAIITTFQQNPKTYWNLATDPRAMQTAVEFLASGSQDSNFTATPQKPQAPLSAGRSESAPTRTAADANSSYTHPAIEQAEKVFGKKFTKDMRAEFKRSIAAGRG